MVPQGEARRGGHHISSEIAQARIATAGPPAICGLRPLASLQARTRKTMFASMLENRKTGMPTRPLSTIATDSAREARSVSCTLRQRRFPGNYVARSWQTER